jgi:fatty-acyl-CoA synthase
VKRAFAARIAAALASAPGEVLIEGATGSEARGEAAALTRAGFRERVKAEAAWLAAQGVGEGQVVAFLGHNSAAMLALLVACAEAGVVLLPLNWRLAAPELAAIVAEAKVAALQAGDGAAALAAEVSALHAPDPHARHRDIEPGDALLVFTSGTTGRAKGVLHTQAGLAANLDAALAAQPIDAASRVLATLPMFHVGGLCIQVLPALAAGARLLLHPRFEPGAWFDAVERWRPGTTLLVPAVMRALIEHPRWPGADLSSLRFVNCGSQVVPLALIEAFHARGVPVTQVYGGTETGPVSVALRPEDALARAGSAGRAALGVRVRVVHPDSGAERPAGEVGEIVLHAPNLMRRYLGGAAAEGFRADGGFATGDLGRIGSDGFVEIVGRLKELIISGGENIHPAEVEALLAGAPGVLECAVVGLPDERWGEVPVLAVVRTPGAVLDAAAILAPLHGRLARFKHPRRVIEVPALPKTALGKLERARLRQSLLEPLP